MSNLSLQTLPAGSGIPAVVSRPGVMAAHGFGARLGVLVAAIDGWVGRAADGLLEWQRRQRDRATLRALDDRMLSDIGLSRADIEAEISKRFWQE